MAGIDESLTFYPLRVAVLTISDSRNEQSDKSGGLLVERLLAAGHELAHKVIVKDEIDPIRAQVRAWVEDGSVDVILSTGGTGFARRDVTPEAVRPLLDVAVPPARHRVRVRPDRLRRRAHRRTISQPEQRLGLHDPAMRRRR